MQFQSDDEEGNYMENLQELRQVTIVPIKSRVSVSVLTQQPSFYSLEEEYMPPWNMKNNEQQMIWSTPFPTESEEHGSSTSSKMTRHYPEHSLESKNGSTHIIRQKEYILSGVRSDDDQLTQHKNNRTCGWKNARIKLDGQSDTRLSLEDLECFSSSDEERKYISEEIDRTRNK